jgi:hypothetical protein
MIADRILTVEFVYTTVIRFKNYYHQVGRFAHICQFVWCLKNGSKIIFAIRAIVLPVGWCEKDTPLKSLS